MLDSKYHTKKITETEIFDQMYNSLDVDDNWSKIDDKQQFELMLID